MDIAIIGTGNIGGALARRWAQIGHNINLGVRNTSSFKGQDLVKFSNINLKSIQQAVLDSEVIVVAVPAMAILDLVQHLQNCKGKIIIDTTNAVRYKPEPYKTVFHCLQDNTEAELVKCFNTTGFENIINSNYNGNGIDMFMAGNSGIAKDVARKLALQLGFSNCFDFGTDDKVELLEMLAMSWINLAIMQGHGRNIAFKLVKR